MLCDLLRMMMIDDNSDMPLGKKKKWWKLMFGTETN